MLNVTVNNRFGLHQRIMLMIMLVLLQFYSIGSDFFPEDIITTSMEMVDQEAPDVLLDFDDNAPCERYVRSKCKFEPWRSI